MQELYSAPGQFWHDKWLSCLFFSLQLTPPLIWQRCLYVALFVSLKLTSIQALIVSTQLPGLGPKSVKALLLFDAQKQAFKNTCISYSDPQFSVKTTWGKNALARQFRQVHILSLFVNNSFSKLYVQS